MSGRGTQQIMTLLGVEINAVFKIQGVVGRMYEMRTGEEMEVEKASYLNGGSILTWS